MQRALKAAAVLSLAALLALGTAGVALAATVVRSGVVAVEVEDRGPDGVHLYLPVPAALVGLAIATLPLWLPAEELAGLRREAAPWQPALAAAAQALAESPDAVLVEVTSDRESVRVEKRGRSLRIAVDGEDAEVHVSLPAHLLSRAAAVLAP